MSWEQVSNAVTFLAFYVASKVGKTGLADVTVDVYRNGTEVVTGAAATEVGDGFYKYELGSGSVTVAGEYYAVFKTADATVDQQHIPALWLIGRAGVENLDAAVSTRLATAGYTTPPTVGAIADAVLDELVTDHDTADSVGQRLQLLGAATVTLTAPVAADGATLSLVRGDDYAFAQSRHLTFTSSSWPNLTGATEVRMTVRRRSEAFGSGSDPVWFTATDRAASRVFGVGSQTVVFELTDTNTLTLTPETAAGKYDIQATLGTGEIITLVTGVVNVTEDQTRPA